jgi:hypothetical protein
MSALLAGKKMPPIPDSIHYASHMLADFGMMLNDTLGCCTCAAYYHARQVWTFNSATAEDTSPDAEVLELYAAACGYRPDQPTTDEGGVEQDVLTFLLNSGAPLAGGQVDKILAFVEVDPRNVEDVKRTIFDCGPISDSMCRKVLCRRKAIHLLSGRWIHSIPPTRAGTLSSSADTMGTAPM